MRLVFAYNADTGLFNTVTDIAHKILSPATYACNLCALTHGYFTIRATWVRFLEDLGHETVFLHRDELHVSHPDVADVPLPAIFAERDAALEPWISRDEIAALSSVEALIALIESRIDLTLDPS